MILITGGSGRLGTALRFNFPDAALPPRSELDITDHFSVDAYVKTFRPSMVIHAGAFTDVALAEKERAQCWRVNVTGTRNVVESLALHVPKCHLIYISTACVFSGLEGDYTEDSIPDPRNFYGLTKLIGEFIVQRMAFHLVVRTNFVECGPWPYPRAFVDRFGTYLYAHDVGAALRELVDTRSQGLIHVAGMDRMSMFELARLTTPHVGTMTMAGTRIPLTVDMTLRSVKGRAYQLTLRRTCGSELL